MKLAELQEKNDQELFDFALEFGAVEEGATPRRMEIFRKVFKACSDKEETIEATGILSILNEGYGFLREKGDQRGAGDVYVSQAQIRRFSLRTGDYVVGDDDGLLVIKPTDAENVIDLAMKKDSLEEEIALRISKGENTLDIFKLNS